MESEIVLYEVFSPVYGYGRKESIRAAWRAAIDSDGPESTSWGELFRIFGTADPRSGAFIETRRERLGGIPAPAPSARSGPSA